MNITQGVPLMLRRAKDKPERPSRIFWLAVTILAAAATVAVLVAK